MVANLLVFINAHLACNYTNRVAVIASHPDRAQWLYPTAVEQKTTTTSSSSRANAAQRTTQDDTQPSKRLKLNGLTSNGDLPSDSSGSKYRPFRLIETEVISNLTTLLNSTNPSSLQHSTSTMIAGALTLALSYINRESIAYAESVVGVATDPTTQQTADTTSLARLQSRILLVNASPTTDLAHQYIPIMNAIFACQRLSIPIDILSLPLPHATDPSTAASSSSSTVFLQQASDATSGIFLPFTFPPPTPQSTPQRQRSHASTALLTLLLGPLLPSPLTRSHLISPTQINIDFRAACFCHRRVIDLGYVCSICLSIFCEPPPNNECLTCGTTLDVGGIGKVPIVVPRRRKKKKPRPPGVEGTSRVATPASAA